MKVLKKYSTVILIFIFVIIDQLLKIFLPKDINIIDGVLRFTYVENTGGAFGILSSGTITVIIANLLAIAVIIRFMVKQKEYITPRARLACIFLLSGGGSNLIDRIFRGYVIDFIDITQIVKFPVFNFADILLTCGWIILIIEVIFFVGKKDRGK